MAIFRTSNILLCQVCIIGLLPDTHNSKSPWKVLQSVNIFLTFNYELKYLFKVQFDISLNGISKFQSENAFKSRTYILSVCNIGPL